MEEQKRQPLNIKEGIRTFFDQIKQLKGLREQLFFLYRFRIVDRYFAVLEPILNELSDDELNDYIDKIKAQLVAYENLSTKNRGITALTFLILLCCTFLPDSTVNLSVVRFDNISTLNGPLILYFSYYFWKSTNSSILEIACKSVLYNLVFKKYENNAPYAHYIFHSGVQFDLLEADFSANTQITNGGKIATSQARWIDDKLLYALATLPPTVTVIISIMDIINPSINFSLSLAVLVISVSMLFSSYLKLGGYVFLPNAFVIHDDIPTPAEKQPTNA